MKKHDEHLIDALLDLAIQEDIGSGDITTESIIPQATTAHALMTAKAEGVISGVRIVQRVFNRFETAIPYTEYVHDGDTVCKGDPIMAITASYHTLLKAERLALNMLQRMSGIATKTARYVAELHGTETKLLDTRKTVPGLRVLDKLAVTHGGGTNHRMGLYDMVMIKDNHINIAGSITQAVSHVRKKVPSHIKIEVETTSLEQVHEAVAAQADIIMLDNMSNDQMQKAVAYINKKALTEASGNMNIKRLRGVAATGVDFISVGALTHSVTALDISMNITLP